MNGSFYIVTEHQATSVGTRLFVMGQWPKASTPFMVRYKIKVVTTSEIYSQVFSVTSNGAVRLPACWLIRNVLSCYFRWLSTYNYLNIGNDIPLTLNVYHSVEIKQVFEDSVWKIKWFINGSLHAEVTNQIPDTVYPDVRVEVAKSEDGAVYYIKDFELEKIHTP